MFVKFSNYHLFYLIFVKFHFSFFPFWVRYKFEKRRLYGIL